MAACRFVQPLWREVAIALRDGEFDMKATRFYPGDVRLVHPFSWARYGIIPADAVCRELDKHWSRHIKTPDWKWRIS